MIYSREQDNGHYDALLLVTEESGVVTYNNSSKALTYREVKTEKKI
jgi:hypothetical protein